MAVVLPIHTFEMFQQRCQIEVLWTRQDLGSRSNNVVHLSMVGDTRSDRSHRLRLLGLLNENREFYILPLHAQDGVRFSVKFSSPNFPPLGTTGMQALTWDFRNYCLTQASIFHYCRSTFAIYNIQHKRTIEAQKHCTGHTHCEQRLLLSLPKICRHRFLATKAHTFAIHQLQRPRQRCLTASGLLGLLITYVSVFPVLWHVRFSWSPSCEDCRRSLVSVKLQASK